MLTSANKNLVSFDCGMRPNKLGEVFPAQLTSFVWENTFCDFSQKLIGKNSLNSCKRVFKACSNIR